MTFILDRFLSLFNGGMKAYKVQDVKREQRIGVTAKNFKELLEKGAEKLKARFSLSMELQKSLSLALYRWKINDITYTQREGNNLFIHLLLIED